jgi:hypothetical protein
MGNGQQLNLSMQMNGPPGRLMDHLRTGIWPSLRQLSFILFTVAAIFALHPAQAQPTGSNTCHFQTSAAGPGFMQSLQAIITHGDLTDVPFIEKTMGVKFTESQNPNLNLPGLALYQNTPASPFGSSILVRLDVNHATPDFFAPGVLGSLLLDADYDGAFTSDCPNMPATDFESFFGGGFAPAAYTNAEGPPDQTRTFPGKDRSTLKLTMMVGQNGVDRIAIDQSFPPSDIRPPPQPAYCKTSTLDGLKFMQMMKTIVDHGDLSDFEFLEKTLGTELTLTGGPSDSYGNPPRQDLYYDGGQIAGSPIAVHIMLSKYAQKHDAQQVGISFAVYSETEANFLSDCLQLTRFQFFSSFGQQGFRAERAGTSRDAYFSKALSVPGNGNSKLTIFFGTSSGSYGYDTAEKGAVTDVGIRQSY